MEKLFSKIKSCKTEEELDKLVAEALEEAVGKSEKVEVLGFGDYSKLGTYHKGFIHPNTRIKFQNLAIETYGMETTDYFYEFAKYIWKTEWIKTQQNFITSLLYFLNQYFGIEHTDKDYRSNVFWAKAKDIKDDDEFFAMMDKNKIGDLKGLGVAQCTERAAVAQNLLSLFGFESYYCFGGVKFDGHSEGHSYNVVKGSKDYFLIDYSVPVKIFYDNGAQYNVPYQVMIPRDKVDGFLNNKETVELHDYDFVQSKNGFDRVEKNDSRYYVMGSDTIKLDSPGL